jgi:hypothetical protein
MFGDTWGRTELGLMAPDISPSGCKGSSLGSSVVSLRAAVCRSHCLKPPSWGAAFGGMANAQQPFRAVTQNGYREDGHSAGWLHIVLLRPLVKQRWEGAPGITRQWCKASYITHTSKFHVLSSSIPHTYHNHSQHNIRTLFYFFCQLFF